MPPGVVLRTPHSHSTFECAPEHSCMNTNMHIHIYIHTHTKKGVYVTLAISDIN